MILPDVNVLIYAFRTDLPGMPHFLLNKHKQASL